MTTRTNGGVRRQSGLAVSPRVVTGLLAGVGGGILFAMWMMMEGLFDQGFFAAPTSIWAFWAGPSAYHPRDFALVPLLLGVMGHMMNSLILAVVMLWVGSFWTRGAIPTLVVAIGKALAIMALTFLIVLPLSPNGAIVYNSSPLWSWAVGHMMFGLGVWAVAWNRGLLPR